MCGKQGQYSDSAQYFACPALNVGRNVGIGLDYSEDKSLDYCLHDIGGCDQYLTEIY